MTAALQDDIMRYVPQTDEPEIRARQRHLARLLVNMDPELRDELRQEWREEGLRPLVHLLERRLGRRLTDEEHRAMRERLGRLGPDRLGDVVLDLSPDALAAWLADPAAS